MTARSGGGGGGRSALLALRAFAAGVREARERCELCGAELGSAHPHILDLDTRALRCACAACVVLTTSREGARFRRVDPEPARLAEMDLDDAAWESLGVPIGVAYFRRGAQGVELLFPSPAGAVASPPRPEAMARVIARNPVLDALAPDTEALLVHRLGGAREHYRVSVEECYRLAGLIRAHWRGLGGGDAVWEELRAFFARLRDEAAAARAGVRRA